MARISFFFVCFFSFLGFPVGQAAELPHREIYVKVASSSYFQFDPEWQKDIRDRIIFANEIFEPLFNIHFKVIEHLNWEPQDELRETALLMEELRDQFPIKQDQIVIGFHRMSQPFSKDKVLDNETIGSAQSFRGYVVIRDPFLNLGTLRKEVVLVHELAHLFGAIHVQDPSAIMNPSLPQKPLRNLDPDNQQIIRIAQRVDFTRGIESLSPHAIQELIRIYEAKVRENPYSDFYHQLGKFYQQLGQPVRAVAIWEEALRYQYENPLIHYELGMSYYQNARYGASVRELGSATAYFFLPSQKKQLASTLNVLGVAYYEQHNVDMAIYHWLQGLAANPSDKILQGNLALAYLEKGQVERGVTELEKLSAMHPKDVTLWSNLGVAYLRANQPSKAAEVLGRAVILKMSSMHSSESTSASKDSLMSDVPEAMIHLNLGAAYLQLKKFEESVRELKRAIQQDPKVYEARQNLIQAYLSMGRNQDAIKEIQAALRYNKDDPYLYAFLGQAYAALNEPSKAIEAAHQGLKCRPKEDLAILLHKNIGILCLNQKRYSEALSELNTAMRMRWKDAEVHTYLGVVFAQTGKSEEAKRSFKTAIQIDPKNEQAKGMLKALEGKPGQK